jgi:3-deoxy-7-phosphoheptulonate synthase
MYGDNTATAKSFPAAYDDPADRETRRIDEGAEFPRVGRSARPERDGSTVRIGDVAFGGREFVLIAGPCAVESQEMVDRAAAAVAKLGARVLRGGAFKPRTSPDTFQGLGLEGVEILRRSAREFGVPFVTEVMSAPMVDEMEPLVDAFQIGARNMQNFALLEAVGRTRVPVLLKRNFGATLSEWLMAAEYIAKGGNDAIILCERGIRSFGQETRFTLDLAGAMWAKQRTHLPVIVDPSHAIGLPELLSGAVAATVAAGLDGAMVEVHPRPERARCDADQALTPGEFEELMQRIAPVARAVGREI